MSWIACHCWIRHNSMIAFLFVFAIDREIDRLRSSQARWFNNSTIGFKLRWGNTIAFSPHIFIVSREELLISKVKTFVKLHYQVIVIRKIESQQQLNEIVTELNWKTNQCLLWQAPPWRRIVLSARTRSCFEQESRDCLLHWAAYCSPGYCSPGSSCQVQIHNLYRHSGLVQLAILSSLRSMLWSSAMHSVSRDWQTSQQLIISWW